MTADTAGAQVKRASHIVAVNGCRTFGGRERWTVDLLRALQERGHRVRFFCRPELVAHSERAGVPARAVRLGGDLAFHHAAQLAVRLRRDPPDALLVAHFAKVWLAGMAARLAAVPRVAARVAVADYDPDTFKYRTALLHWIDVTVLNSNEMRDLWLERVPQLATRHVLRVYKGVQIHDAAGTAPDVVRRELGLAPQTPLVGSIARLHPTKRIDRLIRAVAMLDGVHAALIGGGPMRESLEALAVQLGVGARVHFLGDREDVRTLLRGLDVFVLTSATESMNSSMLEAMAEGIPVVTTPLSGAREALAPLDDMAAPGMIVQPDPSAIANAVRDLLADAELRQRMARAGRAVAATRFDRERMLDVWEQLLLAPLPVRPLREL